VEKKSKKTKTRKKNEPINQRYQNRTGWWIGKVSGLMVQLVITDGPN